jgi:hypothetical protein
LPKAIIRIRSKTPFLEVRGERFSIIADLWLKQLATIQRTRPGHMPWRFAIGSGHVYPLQRNGRKQRVASTAVYIPGEISGIRAGEISISIEIAGDQPIPRLSMLTHWDKAHME